jgi:hypothetical protein
LREVDEPFPIIVFGGVFLVLFNVGFWWFATPFLLTAFFSLFAAMFTSYVVFDSRRRKKGRISPCESCGSPLHQLSGRCPASGFEIILPNHPRYVERK